MAIRPTERGLDESFTHNADNKAQEVHHSHDFGGRRYELGPNRPCKVACIWFFMIFLLIAYESRLN